MEETRFVPIAELDEDGLRQLASLHDSVMHTLLSDLGLPFVLKYYQVARSDKSVLGVCALGDSRKVIGWAMGSSAPSAINARLRQPLTWFLLQMMHVAVTRPLVLKQLISSVLSASAESEMNPGAIELTYIGVSTAQQRKGLGRSLLQTFIEESRQKGYHSVVLSVEEQNGAAVALYEKFGFKIIKSFSEGRYRRHRMELSLV